jgi:hypothetical protein
MAGAAAAGCWRCCCIIHGRFFFFEIHYTHTPSLLGCLPHGMGRACVVGFGFFLTWFCIAWHGMAWRGVVGWDGGAWSMAGWWWCWVWTGLDWTGLDSWILDSGMDGSGRVKAGQVRRGKREAGMKYASTGNDNVLDKGGGGRGRGDDYTCLACVGWFCRRGLGWVGVPPALVLTRVRRRKIDTQPASLARVEALGLAACFETTE